MYINAYMYMYDEHRFSVVHDERPFSCGSPDELILRYSC